MEIRDELKIILMDLIKQEIKEPNSENSLHYISELAHVLELLTR